MNFIFHNKLEIKNQNKTLTFYNTLNHNVLEKLKNKESYNNYISIGSGVSESPNNFKLIQYLKTYALETEFVQSDISKGQPYIKKTFAIKNELPAGTAITELGLSDNSNNPILFNYFSCVSEESPEGIIKERNEDILISIYIYINIQENSEIYLCSGNNKWIEFLLGNGLSGNIYTARGKNLTSNKTIKREFSSLDEEKFLTTLNFSLNDNVLNFEFNSCINSGITHEIVLMIENNPFARINVQNNKSPTQTTLTLNPVNYDVINCGTNIYKINSIKNNSTNESENNYLVKKYASDYGDKIFLPFDNLFNNLTPRFVSRNGKYIFFVLDDYIYGYTNEDFEIKPLLTNNLRIFNISKIICSSDYVLVFSMVEPYLSVFKIENYKLIPISVNSNTSLSFFSETSNPEAVLSDNTLMIGYIAPENNFAHTLFFEIEENNIVYKNTISSEYKFSIILAMDKNHYENGKIIYVKEGEFSYESMLVTHFSDETKKEINTILAYEFSNNIKEAYVKERGVVIEKSNENKVYLYIYPGVYQYNIPSIDGADDYYFSNNLLYVITKNDKSFTLRNIIGYKTTNEFSRNIFDKLDQSKIENFEFLNDTLLIFTNNKNEPILAYNLFIDSIQIENVSSEESSYDIDLLQFNLLGDNNETVNVKFLGEIKI